MSNTAILNNEYASYKNDKVVRFADSLRNGWRKFPPALQVGITDYCLNQCVMCGHHTRTDKEVLNTYIWMTFLKEVGKPSNLEAVGYSGGDPFVINPKELLLLMQTHIDLEILFGFVTSGFLAEEVHSNQEFMEALEQASWVRVSLDAVSPALYKELRGGPGFGLLDRSVQEMLNHGVNVEAGVTITNLNYDHLHNIFEYVNRRGIKEMRVWAVRNSPALELDAEQEKVLAGELAECANMCDQAGIRHNMLYTLEEEKHSFSKCYACMYQWFIDAKGDIYPCCVAAGDIRSSPEMGKPFGNIKTIFSPRGAAKMWEEKVVPFHEKSMAELPEFCRDRCMARLAVANELAESCWNKKDFQ